MKLTKEEFEAGFRKWMDEHGLAASWFSCAAAYYATLQERKGEGMSVEGGLTREWMSEAWDDDSLNSVDKVLDAIWSRIEAERAAWNVERLALVHDVAEARESLANSIPMPKWEDAPEGTTHLEAVWINESLAGYGRYRRTVQVFPRPVAEREMTRAEKISAVQDAHWELDQLSDEFLDELMKLAGLKTTTGGK